MIESSERELRVIRASSISPRPVQWLWQDRVAAGAIALLAGREGIGKSILSYSLVADITRGRLDGRYVSEPRSVIVVATEDSWEHTIIPRLMAAGADLDLVLQIEPTVVGGVSLPRHLDELKTIVKEQRAVAVILDPLISRLSAKLDTHKDGDVRRAMEPLAAFADRAGVSVLGLIHVNKSGSTDALTTIMGSRAFAAVARSVLFVLVDPEDESRRLLGQPKNNLGRTDLPTLVFKIQGQKVADTEEGEVWTGKLHWEGDDSRSIRDCVEAAAHATGDRSAASEAGDWLIDYLNSQGGRADAGEIMREGSKAGHSKDSIRRAKNRLKVTSVSSGFPRRAVWFVSSTTATAITTTTATNALNGEIPVDAVDAVCAMGGTTGGADYCGLSPVNQVQRRLA